MLKILYLWHKFYFFISYTLSSDLLKREGKLRKTEYNEICMFKGHKVFSLPWSHTQHTHTPTHTYTNSVGTETYSITCTIQVACSIESEEKCQGVLVNGDPVTLSEWWCFLLPRWGFWKLCTYLTVVWAMWSHLIKSSLSKVNRYMETRPGSLLTADFNQKVNSSAPLI